VIYYNVRTGWVAKLTGLIPHIRSGDMGCCEKKAPCETEKKETCETEKKETCETEKKETCETEKKETCETEKKSCG
jgi:hypothetical protein